jgi:hypothetical protein
LGDLGIEAISCNSFFRVSELGPLKIAPDVSGPTKYEVEVRAL